METEFGHSPDNIVPAKSGIIVVFDDGRRAPVVGFGQTEEGFWEAMVIVKTGHLVFVTDFTIDWRIEVDDQPVQV